MGWQGLKAIVDALSKADYKWINSFRIWAGKIQDEGARLLSQYLCRYEEVAILELLDCAITPLGCEFLNNVFMPGTGGKLQVIKLDHNPLGSEGMNIIAQGLSQNTMVNVLSLTYCEIGPEGCEGLFQVILYQNSNILELSLNGNPLMDEGIVQIFHGLAAAKNLQSVYLCDCQFDMENEDVLAAMKIAMVTNIKINKYDLKHNAITDDGIEALVEILGEAKHVQMLTVSEWITSEAFQQLLDALAANKPAKGKKGKKKK